MCKCGCGGKKKSKGKYECKKCGNVADEQKYCCGEMMQEKK